MALNQYKSLFVQHARERVARFEDVVLLLEKHPHDVGLITDLMATLHTVKSDASTMHYMVLATVIQDIEGFLQPYRQGTRRLTPRHINDLFRFIDQFRSDLDSIASGGLEIDFDLPWVSRDSSRASAKATTRAKDTSTVSWQSRVSESELTLLMRKANELVRLHQRNIRLLQRGDTGALFIAQHALAMDLSSMRDQVVTMTMVSVDEYFAFLERFVRDTATKEKKNVNFSMDDGGLKLELKVLDGLRDACIQMVKNAVAHGVRQKVRGVVSLAFSLAENVVTVTVRDTGVGIDFRELERRGISEKIFSRERLARITAKDRPLFLVTSGVSTRVHATDVSGRGVGMLGVKRSIQDLGGTLAVVSHRGENHGTLFTVSLSLQPSLFRALVWRWGSYVLGLPFYVIEKIIQLPRVAATPSHTMSVSGISYPIVSFTEALGLVGADRFEAGAAALIRTQDATYALLIPNRFEEQELIMEQVSPLVHHPLIMGVSVTEYGVPITVLNYRSLITKHVKG